MVTRPESTGGASICVDWCPVSQIPVLQRFIHTYWSSGHVLAEDAELLRWQYVCRGEPERLSFLTAKARGEIVGILGLIPVDFCLHGSRARGAWLAMWMAAPEWRCHRVGLRLLQQAMAGEYAVLAVLGSNRAGLHVYRGLRFDTCDEGLARWVHVICPDSLCSLLQASPRPFPEEDFSTWIRSSRCSAVPVPAGLRHAGWSDEAAKRWDHVWHQRFAPQICGTWRDSSYLRWRYIQHPRFHYHLIFAENRHDRQIEGLLVYRVETVQNRTEKVVRVVEFLATETAGAFLAYTLLEGAQVAGAAFADFYCASARFSAPLESAGFVRQDRMPTPLPALFQPLAFEYSGLTGAIKFQVSTERTSVFARPDLYITRSDGDQDRPN